MASPLPTLRALGLSQNSTHQLHVSTYVFAALWSNESSNLYTMTLRPISHDEAGHGPQGDILIWQVGVGHLLSEFHGFPTSWVPHLWGH